VRGGEKGNTSVFESGLKSIKSEVATSKCKTSDSILSNFFLAQDELVMLSFYLSFPFDNQYSSLHYCVFNEKSLTNTVLCLFLPVCVTPEEFLDIYYVTHLNKNTHRTAKGESQGKGGKKERICWDVRKKLSR